MKSLAGTPCPQCTALGREGLLVPTTQGNAVRCSTPGNRYIGGRWTICSFRHFDGDPIRPTSFPVIANPTHEQLPIRDWFGSTPARKRGRLLLINAGPGCGKTSTVAWAAQAAWERLGDLARYFFVAFNRNARDVLEGRLPSLVPGVYTLNGLGMTLQGYSGVTTEDDKLARLFREVVANVSAEDRPEFGGVDEFLDRMRAWGLYRSWDDEWWPEAVRSVAGRFGLDEVEADLVSALADRALARKETIDLAEQWSRAVSLAMASSGLYLPADVCRRGFEFTPDVVAQLARVVRAVRLPQLRGLVIDEGQDLSLAQVLFFVATVWRSGELVVIGDDRRGAPGEAGYKAGQGVFGWRGAFSGSMALVGRLWAELTGEVVTELPLSVTFRSAPEVVEAFRGLNTTLTSAKPVGSGFAYRASFEEAFGLWCGMPEGKTAFWVTRTNREAGRVLLATIKARIPCAFRGGDGFERQLHAVLKVASGGRERDRCGEYPVSLAQAVATLEEVVAARAASGECLEAFVLEVAGEVLASPDVLLGVEGLPHTRSSLGNVRRLILAYCDKDAARCVTNVYRVKGDEADWVFVGDEAFNKAWNGDEDEAAACRLVACSRAATGLVVCTDLAGVSVPDLPVGHGIPQASGRVALKARREKTRKKH